LKNESFLIRNISGFTRVLESVFLTHELYQARGILQKLDPRIKTLGCIFLVVIVGLSQNIWILLFILSIIFLLGIFSRIPVSYFLKRMFLFIPIFTLVIALPALFITPGDLLISISDKVIITVQGARSSGFLFLRVTDSISTGLLLILTTPWSKILLSLRWFHLPSIIIDILGMTYRYIFLFLHTANSMFLARRSRSLGTFSGKEDRVWLTSSMAVLFSKSQHLGEEVFLSMLSRGYREESVILYDLKMKREDYIGLILILSTIFCMLWINYH
jgi:cobalt/nickel transport system permease protein